MNEALDLNNWRDEPDDRRQQRDWWWKSLYNLRAEWMELVDYKIIETGGQFEQWLEDIHGVQMILDAQGLITADYKVVDEKKFLMFIIKYT